MPRSRPASNSISYHKYSKQYYVRRGGNRLYLGPDKDEALKKYHRLGLGFEAIEADPGPLVGLTVKGLANRFVATEEANLREPRGTLRSYKDLLGRFLEEHPRLNAVDFTVERFATWKLSLKKRGYYLSPLTAIFPLYDQSSPFPKMQAYLKRVQSFGG